MSRRVGVETRQFIKRILLGKSVEKTAARAILWAIGAFIVFRFVLIPMRTYSASGEGLQFHLVNALAFRFSAPARGDKVAIRMAGSRIMFLGLLVAKPGESLEVKEGVIFINDQPLSEKGEGIPARYERTTLGSDEYFVIGESSTVGSIEFGRVARERLVGRLLF